jgi:hypothetical protein
LTPYTCFRLKNCVKISGHPISPRKIWTRESLKRSQVDLKVTCHQRWKAFDSISIIGKMQHLEVSFDGKCNAKWWFLVILRCPLVAMVTVNLRLSMRLQRLWSYQHVCQVWTVLRPFYSLIAIGTCNRKLCNENSQKCSWSNGFKDDGLKTT